MLLIPGTALHAPQSLLRERKYVCRLNADFPTLYALLLLPEPKTSSLTRLMLPVKVSQMLFTSVVVGLQRLTFSFETLYSIR